MRNRRCIVLQTDMVWCMRGKQSRQKSRKFFNTKTTHKRWWRLRYQAYQQGKGDEDIRTDRTATVSYKYRYEVIQPSTTFKHIAQYYIRSNYKWGKVYGIIFISLPGFNWCHGLQLAVRKEAPTNRLLAYCKSSERYFWAAWIFEHRAGINHTCNSCLTF